MNPACNLILIGPMGAGKTTIGKRLAEHYRLRFVDADQVIEAHTGVAVREVFDREGEAGFRRREQAVLQELCAQTGLVIATGGGAVLAEANRSLLRARGFVVWLRTSVDRQLERLAHDRARPLLQAPDRRQRLAELAAQRDPLYAKCCDWVFDSDQARAARAAALLVQQLDLRWQRSAAAA